MKKGLKIFFLALLLLIVIGAVIVVTTPTRKLLSLFAPKIDRVRITDTRINEEMVTMNVLAHVKPSLLSGVVDSISYRLSLYDTEIARGHKSFEQAEKQGNDQILKLPMTMNHNKTRELVRRQVKEGEKVQAHIEAYADVPFFGRRKFDIDQDLDMVVPALPGATVTDLRITDFGLDEMEMITTLSLDNPNEFDFYIRDMKMTLNFPDKVTSVGGTVKDFLVKAQSVTPINIHTVSDVKNPIKTTVKTLTGDQVWAYSMKTYMVLEPKSDVVGIVKMDAVKTGEINVVRQVKKALKNRKEEKKAERQEKKEEKKEQKQAEKAQ